MTAAKFKPFIFPVSGFALSNIANIFVFIPHLDKYVQEGRIHFQQDESPPHYLGEMREQLNIRFPGRWIGTYFP
jgi:hypothetical protein